MQFGAALGWGKFNEIFRLQMNSWLNVLRALIEMDNMSAS